MRGCQLRTSFQLSQEVQTQSLKSHAPEPDLSDVQEAGIGGTVGAQAGTLAIMVGGEQTGFPV